MIRRIPILLLIVGVFAQEQDKSKVIPLEIISKSQCYKDGYLAGNKFSKDDAISFSLGAIIVAAPFTYIIIGAIRPNTPNDLLIDKNTECKDSFIKGYEHGAKARRRSSLIKGSITLIICLMISSGFIN